MNEHFRDRVLGPVLIPLLAILVTEVVVFSMSRVLLTGGKWPAVGIALAAALGIVGGAAVIANRPRLKSGSVVGLLVVAFVAVVAAGAWAMAKGPAPIEAHEGAAPSHDVFHVVAKDLVFDPTVIELPADKQVEIMFVNQDPIGTQHNISIFPSKTQLNDPLFRGELVDGGVEATYEIAGLPAGDYYFHCDVHPTMTGTVKSGDFPERVAA
jgi:plastocyanin